MPTLEQDITNEDGTITSVKLPCQELAETKYSDQCSFAKPCFAQSPATQPNTDDNTSTFSNSGTFNLNQIKHFLYENNIFPTQNDTKNVVQLYLYLQKVYSNRLRINEFYRLYKKAGGKFSTFWIKKVINQYLSSVSSGQNPTSTPVSTPVSTPTYTPGSTSNLFCNNTKKRSHEQILPHYHANKKKRQPPSTEAQRLEVLNLYAAHCAENNFFLSESVFFTSYYTGPYCLTWIKQRISEYKSAYLEYCQKTGKNLNLAEYYNSVWRAQFNIPDNSIAPKACQF